MVGFPGCKCTLLTHVQYLASTCIPQVLLLRAAFNPLMPQPVLIPGAALTKVKVLALGPIEPHEVHTGLPLQLIQVLLD